MVQPRVGSNHRQTSQNSFAIRNRGRHLGDQPLGFTHVGGVVGRRRLLVRIKMSQHAHRRP